MRVPPSVLEEADRINAYLADVKKLAADHGFEISSATVKPDFLVSYHTMEVIFCAKKQ